MNTKTMMTLVLSVVFFMTGSPVTCQNHPSDSLSLHDCIQLAMKNNYSVKSAHLASRVAQVDHREARQHLIPNVALSVGHNLSQGRSIDLVTNQYINQNFSSGNQSISGSVTLFRGLEALHRIRQHASAHTATLFEEQAVKDELMLDVIAAYIQLLTARDMVTQTELRVALTRQQVKRISDLHRVGAASPADFYELKSQLAADLNALNEIRKTHMDAQIAMAALINIPLHQLTALRALTDQHLKSMPLPTEPVEKAVARLPSIQAAEWRIRQSHDAIRVARSAHSPRITLGGGFQSTYSSNSELGYFDQAKNNLGRYLSFGITIPITDHLLIKNNLTRAKIGHYDTQLRTESATLDWQRTILQTRFNLQVAQENYVNLKQREEYLSESFRIATSKFEAGDSHSVLFLTTKNNLDQAIANRVIGRYQWLLQQYLSDYFSGHLSFN